MGILQIHFLISQAQLDIHYTMDFKGIKVMSTENIQEIVVAGGCFWGVEEYYQRLKGVIATETGYAQGIKDNPTYEEVCTMTTDHAEVVKVTYDADVISLEKILEHLFRMIDPISLNQQGGDVGTQYRTGVYYTNNADLPIIKAFITKEQQAYSAPIAVEVEKLTKMWPAEEYHQTYLQKNPSGYCHINFSLIKPNELK